MHVLSLDCSGEFTGESLVGALAGLGVTPSTFEWELGHIELGDYHLHFDREEIAGIRAIRFGVHGGAFHTDHAAHHHTTDHHHAKLQNEHVLIGYPVLRKRLETASLSESLKSRCSSVLQRIAAARSESVGTTIDQVNFSEVEALESLVTLVLACVGLDQLQVPKIYFLQRKQSSNESAAQQAISRAILAKISASVTIEATPLGAALLAEFGTSLDTAPGMKSIKSSCGLGPSTESGALLQATLGEVG
jgi:pyridinium-3,5-bisthiocarboxylic acid mononucleotide nickel chelatase